MESATTPGAAIVTTSLKPDPGDLVGNRLIRVWSTSVCVEGIFSRTSAAPPLTVTVSLAPPTFSAIFRFMGTEVRTLKFCVASSKPLAATLS